MSNEMSFTEMCDCEMTRALFSFSEAEESAYSEAKEREALLRKAEVEIYTEADEERVYWDDMEEARRVAFSSQCSAEKQWFETLKIKVKEPMTITLAENSEGYGHEVDRLSKIICPQCKGELGFQILNKDDYWNSRSTVVIRSHIISLCPHCGQKILLETKQVL